LTAEVIGEKNQILKLVNRADTEEEFVAQMNVLAKDVFDQSIERRSKYVLTEKFVD
jgi:hypothetical protein